MMAECGKDDVACFALAASVSSWTLKGLVPLETSHHRPQRWIILGVC